MLLPMVEGGGSKIHDFGPHRMQQNAFGNATGSSFESGGRGLAFHCGPGNFVTFPDHPALNWGDNGEWSYAIMLDRENSGEALRAWFAKTAGDVSAGADASNGGWWLRDSTIQTRIDDLGLTTRDELEHSSEFFDGDWVGPATVVASFGASNIRSFYKKISVSTNAIVEDLEILDQARSVVNSDTTSDLAIGQWADFGGFEPNGLIYYFALWNRALSDREQIAIIASQGAWMRKARNRRRLFFAVGAAQTINGSAISSAFTVAGGTFAAGGANIAGGAIPSLFTVAGGVLDLAGAPQTIAGGAISSPITVTSGVLSPGGVTIAGAAIQSLFTVAGGTIVAAGGPQSIVGGAVQAPFSVASGVFALGGVNLIGGNIAAPLTVAGGVFIAAGGAQTIVGSSTAAPLTVAAGAFLAGGATILGGTVTAFITITAGAFTGGITPPDFVDGVLIARTFVDDPVVTSFADIPLVSQFTDIPVVRSLRD